MHLLAFVSPSEDVTVKSDQDGRQKLLQRNYRVDGLDLEGKICKIYRIRSSTLACLFLGLHEPRLDSREAAFSRAYQ
jgi:hypothetical protein